MSGLLGTTRPPRRWDTFWPKSPDHTHISYSIALGIYYICLIVIPCLKLNFKSFNIYKLNVGTLGLLHLFLFAVNDHYGTILFILISFGF